MEVPNLVKAEFIKITGSNNFSWYKNKLNKLFIVHTWKSAMGNILVYVVSNKELVLREVKPCHCTKVQSSLEEILRRT